MFFFHVQPFLRRDILSSPFFNWVETTLPALESLIDHGQPGWIQEVNEAVNKNTFLLQWHQFSMLSGFKPTLLIPLRDKEVYEVP